MLKNYNLKVTPTRLLNCLLPASIRILIKAVFKFDIRNKIVNQTVKEF